MTIDMNRIIRRGAQRDATPTESTVIEDVSAVAAALPPARLAEFAQALLAAITDAAGQSEATDPTGTTR